VFIDVHYVNTGNASTVETIKYQDSNIVSFMMRGKNLLGNPRPSIHLSGLDFLSKKRGNYKALSHPRESWSRSFSRTLLS
jgi:hypothetical protein